MRVVGWAAAFEGGQFFVDADPSAMRSGTDGGTGAYWRGLPHDGLIAVMLFYDSTSAGGKRLRRMMSGSDYYFKMGEVYGASNETDDAIAARYPGAEIIRGKWVSDQEYHDATERLREWVW